MKTKMKLNMCNLYIRDKVKDRGWEHVGRCDKVRNLLTTLWLEKKKIYRILGGQYYYMRQVELVLTTKCSLKCKECANLMQYYKKPYEIEQEKILTAVNTLLSYIDEINTVVLVGGEPFLYTELASVIEHVTGFHKVNHIHIFTNGTIVPRPSLIAALRNPKVKIIISDYGEISRKKYELQEYCQKNKINFYLKNKDLYWGYVGNMNPRRRTCKELNHQFRKCNNFCRSILNGKLFYCPRAAHGDDLGYVHASKNEYVDLLNDKVSSAKILRLVYSDHFFSACDFCNYGTKEMFPVTPGVQVSIGEKEKIYKK